jgi:hypothetical protein
MFSENSYKYLISDLCVLPSLPGTVDNRARHFLECAQKAVKKLGSVGLITKKAEKCALNLFNSKKAKAAAKGYYFIIIIPCVRPICMINSISVSIC